MVTTVDLIKVNKLKLFELENAVMDNHFQVSDLRYQIEEHRACILKNYSAIFGANRTTMDNTTLRMMKNRAALLSELPSDNPTVQILKNEATLSVLELRAKLSDRMAKVNNKMSMINNLLVEVNEMIMMGNAEVLEFNIAQIELNEQLFNGELGIVDTTDESNAARVEVNTDRIVALAACVATTEMELAAGLESETQAHASLLKNTPIIVERRAQIEKQAAKASETSNKIVARSREQMRNL